MTARRPKRASQDEIAYIRQVERESAFDLIEQGRARILARDDYPEPFRRFLERERTIVHVKLSATTKRKLEARSRRMRSGHCGWPHPHLRGDKPSGFIRKLDGAYRHSAF